MMLSAYFSTKYCENLGTPSREGSHGNSTKALLACKTYTASSLHMGNNKDDMAIYL